ncbi:PREDICTED: pancreatic triacylglycerol lipase-like [Habropoda laboriosa]|uniref:pancreatic triacylglycerol lipase-like n=1 Tax=Habropoda laboriosa TaxID=597456 RepID=UPI00083E66E8|nr:PREDICTED: pancreatic triacylglycerol lipase-like [Habropoda laboriosa]XP_017793318.1 PREDICTED: pancreatic triacylglycerol lipase-like [Habropoda laboriosa]
MIFLYISVLFVVATPLLTDATYSATDSMFLRLYIKNSSFLDVNIRNAEQLVSRLKSNETLVMYIHGFTESADSEGATLVSEAYLANTKHNILAVDYRKAAALSYLSCISLIEDIAKNVADALNAIVFSDVKVTNTHLIGHSLGSHIAGSVARHTNFRVSRITGLDPAGPFFYLLNPRLTAGDADFVDIIHTDMGIYGLALSIGHVDFFPNFGIRAQPGCWLIGAILGKRDLCSHGRSYKFYVESVTSNNFIGMKCSSIFDMFSGICNQHETAVMGYGTPTDTRGDYFLKTNEVRPYARGLSGIHNGYER